jgi:hypothetical protein
MEERGKGAHRVFLKRDEVRFVYILSLQGSLCILWGEELQGFGDRAANSFGRSGGSISEEVFEVGK